MDVGGSVMLAKPTSCRMKLVVEPRNLHEGFVQGGLNSATPTPMIFGSSLLTDRDLYTDCKPFFLSLLTETPESPNFAQAAPVDGLASDKSATDTPTDNRAEELADVKLEGAGEDYHESQFISSARYKAMVPSRLPITASSPHLTISPGISPTSLLESPILFNSQQMDASPTTGSFLMPLDAWGDGLPPRDANAKENGVIIPERNDSFVFKPLPLAEGYGSPPNISLGTFEMDAQGNSQYSDGIHMQAEGYGYGASQASDLRASGISSGGVEADQGHLDAAAAGPPATVVLTGVTSTGRLVLDGYNWKKYGQKTLKNSENPRNYYKCTHPNCPAKRRVECSDAGDVIINKGAHNHAKPEGNRRRGKPVGHGGAHPDSARGSMAGSNVLTQVINTVDDMPSSSAPYPAGHGSLSVTPELSFTSPSNEEDEIGDASMLGSYDSEDQSHLKRRRLNDGEEEEEDRLRESLIRTAREPRVIVQTVSEQDVIDDGYRWRKYGQKVVKGHYHPRNYYKCTNAGCRVKKLVERSSSDIRSVMTTYEGKHNHAVPRPARGSSVGPENEDPDMFCDDDLQQLDSQDGGCGSESNSQIY